MRISRVFCLETSLTLGECADNGRPLHKPARLSMTTVPANRICISSVLSTVWQQAGIGGCSAEVRAYDNANVRSVDGVRPAASWDNKGNGQLSRWSDQPDKGHASESLNHLALVKQPNY